MSEDNMPYSVGFDEGSRGPKRRKKSERDEDERPQALVAQFEAKIREGGAHGGESRKRTTSSEYYDDELGEAGFGEAALYSPSSRSRTESSSIEEAGAASPARPKRGVALLLAAEELVPEDHLPIFDIKALYDALPNCFNPEPGISAGRGTPAPEGAELEVVGGSAFALDSVTE